MTAALAFRATAFSVGTVDVADATDFSVGATDFVTTAPAEDSFTLEDYVSLFVYDGPARPGILDSDLVTLAS